tara:strand:- start:469 stop:1158 length:690 start_codon:yes stop_codon:yes gene_type:complete
LASIYDNISRLQEQVAKVANRIGRDPNSVQIVAVSKTKPVGAIHKVLDAGVIHIGENRVQEAKVKYDAIDRPATWHMIGHLQTNKIKQAIQFFDLIQSVDSLRLAKAIDRRSTDLGIQQPILIQVNTSGEASKFGIMPNQVQDFIKQASTYSNIQIKGLMTIGKPEPDPESVRPSFSMLRKLRDDIATQNLINVDMNCLSMGMTNDFGVAIEEGANCIRIGRSIFGERN